MSYIVKLFLNFYYTIPTIVIKKYHWQRHNYCFFISNKYIIFGIYSQGLCSIMLSVMYLDKNQGCSLYHKSQGTKMFFLISWLSFNFECLYCDLWVPNALVWVEWRYLKTIWFLYIVNKWPTDTVCLVRRFEIEGEKSSFLMEI